MRATPLLRASAVVYSLMLTCRACGIEPLAYLRHVLTELPQRPTDANITDLLPCNFAKNRRYMIRCGQLAGDPVKRVASTRMEMSGYLLMAPVHRVRRQCRLDQGSGVQCRR